MVNSRAYRNLILLDKHIATGTEASYILLRTFKPTDYSKIFIEIMGAATATLQLQLIINSDETSNYHYHRDTRASGTSAIEEVVSAAFFELASATLIDAATAFNISAEIILNSLDEKYINYRATAQKMAAPDEEKYTGLVGSQTENLTEIEIQTSTSTWIAGTEITIYGLLK